MIRLFKHGTEKPKVGFLEDALRVLLDLLKKILKSLWELIKKFAIAFKKEYL